MVSSHHKLVQRVDELDSDRSLLGVIISPVWNQKILQAFGYVIDDMVAGNKLNFNIQAAEWHYR